MAVYWVDPYHNSTNGRLHGYTGSGTLGTYTNPFEGDGDCNTISGLADGDEVRIKGLAEASFFGSQETLTAITYGGVSTQHSHYTAGSGSAFGNNVVRFRTDQSQRVMMAYTYSNKLSTCHNSGTWQQGFPYLDTTYGYYAFDTDYKITNAINILTTNTVYGVTITAGWVSETAQTGVTILFSSSTCYMGYNYGFTSTTGNPLTINAANLHCFSTNTTFRADVATLGHCGSTGAAQYVVLYISDSATVESVTNTWGTSIYAYNYKTGLSQTVIDVKFFNFQYYSTFSFSTSKSDSQANWKLICTEWYRTMGVNNLSMNLYSATHTLDFDFATNHHFSQDNGKAFFGTGGPGTVTVNSTTRTYEFGWSSNVLDGFFSGDEIDGTYKSITTPVTETLKIANGAFDVASMGGSSPSAFHAVWVKSINNTGSLDLIDSKLMKASHASVYGTPIKLNVLADGNMKKPCQLMWSSNYTTNKWPIVISHSPNFSDKLTWHFSSYTNGGIYTETFAIDMPTIAALDFDCAFTTSSTPGVTIKAQLYTANSSGVATGYGLQTASVSGTAATISQAIASSTFTTNDAKTAYVIVEMTKTSTAVANVSINTLGLS